VSVDLKANVDLNADAGAAAAPAHRVLALDVGGTGIKAGTVTRSGELEKTWRRATEISRGPDAVIETIVGFAAELVAELAASGSPVSAVGVALPGIVDEKTGTGVFSATVGWRNVPFHALLSERLALPVAVGHDVRAGGVAEARLGAGRGASRFVFLPIGTSIAGAVMIDGRAESGEHGAAGEIGHIVVRPGGEPCDCGLRGCTAVYSSAGGIAKRFRAAGGTAESGADVAALVLTGDPLARRIWDEAVAALADALLTTSAILDPQLVVVGGGLAESGDTLLGPVREALAALVTYHTIPELVPAELGDLAGCLGAGLMAWDLVDAAIVAAAPIATATRSAAVGVIA
jgi:glucokinase